VSQHNGAAAASLHIGINQSAIWSWKKYAMLRHSDPDERDRNNQSAKDSHSAQCTARTTKSVSG
jgi:hypothetical protein